jgi:cytochrome c peroxidase
MNRYLLLILMAFTVCVACEFFPVETIGIEEPYVVELPPAFSPLPVPEDNPLTVAGVTLGERLFFDPILSADSSISCATCHLPEFAFTDQQAISVGIKERPGQRNAPSLINVAYQHTGLFWDGRVSTLEEQALIPVVSAQEMGNTWENVEQALNADKDYVMLFREAFPDEADKPVNRSLVAKALAQYQRTLLSENDSRYDRAERGEITLTASEKRGKAIFFDESATLPNGECAHCHLPPLFTDQTFMNNGLDTVEVLEDYPDKGRAAVTGQRYDLGRFKVPGLRNVELTAPYMHNGSLKTLEEVVAHYNSGGHFAENVDPKIRKLHLSDRDQQDLVNFLKTLTDRKWVKTEM